MSEGSQEGVSDPPELPPNSLEFRLNKLAQPRKEEKTGRKKRPRMTPTPILLPPKKAKDKKRSHKTEATVATVPAEDLDFFEPDEPKARKIPR